MKSLQKIKKSEIKVFKRKTFKDERGLFTKLFDLKDYFGSIPDFKVHQINHSYNYKKGIIRGLHYQLKPFAENKIISCMRGKIFDVALDLRFESSTFLKLFTFELSSENKKSILIPKGFAHGFQTLTDNVEIIYIHDKNYKKKSERTINPLDPKISIEWPLKKKIISNKDINSNFLNDSFKGILV